jgi:hypothetical protein
MRSTVVALAVLAAASVATPAWSDDPSQFIEDGGGRLSYAAGDWCAFPITYRFQFTSRSEVFSSDGVSTKILQHVRSRGWFRNDRTGTTITFRSSATVATDLTVEDFTSDYFVYRGVIDLYRSADGGVLAVRRGQFRLSRSGDVTFDAAEASRYVDFCPFLV